MYEYELTEEDPGTEERVPLPNSSCVDLIISETDGLSQVCCSHLLNQHSRSQSKNYTAVQLLTVDGKSESKVNGDVIHYVDGPLDGALYALVNPVKTKPPSSADSGISVSADQMKDLDRLLNALVQEAESIPDIPYHARHDSLPFSYGVPPQETLKLHQEQQFRQQTNTSQYPPALSWRHMSESYTGQPKSTISESDADYPRPIPISALAQHPTTSRGSSYTESERVFFDSFSDSFSSPPPPPLPQETTYYSQPDKFSQSQPRVRHLHLDLEDQTTPHSHISTTGITSGTGLNWDCEYKSSPSSQQQQSQRNILEYYNSQSLQKEIRSGSIQQYSSSRHQCHHHQLQPTSSFNNLSSILEGSSERRMRSQSADGRPREGDENADEWLARQMQRLQEKRARKNMVKNDWLLELKRTLPQQQQEERSCELESYRHQNVRPSSSNIIHSIPRSNVSTPGLYSSDEEEFDREVEREMFPNRYYQNQSRGRQIQRYHSASAYDRVQRAPSQQSNTSTIGAMGDLTTPGFPTCPPTPYLNRPVSPGKPPRSPKLLRRSGLSTLTPTITVNEWITTMSPTEPRAQTPVNPRPVFMVESEVKFARDLSSFWYKPNASREETIAALRYQTPGVFIVRNSNSFPGAYGLAIKVRDSTTVEESVRHFLIEPTKYGVRLRGSAVEPVFGSLSALVYAHSIEPLAMPTTLTLPAGDIVLPVSQSQSTTAHLLTQGAACQLLFLGVVGVECITGDEAITRAIATVSLVSTPTVISLRLSKQGLTLTDVFRQRFFRLHFPIKGISYAALDPSNRAILYGNQPRKLFSVVARSPSATENSCVVLAELEDGQPAMAIVAFFSRVIAWQT